MRRSNNAGAMTPPKNGNTELVVACANPRNGPCQKHTHERLDVLCLDMLPPSLQRKAGDGRGKEAVFQCCTSRTAAQQTRAPFPVMAFLRDNRNQRQCRVGLPSWQSENGVSTPPVNRKGSPTWQPSASQQFVWEFPYGSPRCLRLVWRDRNFLPLPEAKENLSPRFPLRKFVFDGGMQIIQRRLAGCLGRSPGIAMFERQYLLTHLAIAFIGGHLPVHSNSTSWLV